MAGRVRTLVFTVFLLFFPVWAGSARAGVEPSPFSEPLLASAFEPPVFWVMFNPQPEPPAYELRRMSLDISDPVRLLGHLFLGSSRPPEPFTLCGADVSEEKLGCATFKACP